MPSHDVRVLRMHLGSTFSPATPFLELRTPFRAQKACLFSSCVRFGALPTSSCSTTVIDRASLAPNCCSAAKKCDFEQRAGEPPVRQNIAQKVFMQ